MFLILLQELQLGAVNAALITGIIRKKNRRKQRRRRRRQ